MTQNSCVCALVRAQTKLCLDLKGLLKFCFTCKLGFLLLSHGRWRTNVPGPMSLFLSFCLLSSLSLSLSASVSCHGGETKRQLCAFFSCAVSLSVPLSLLCCDIGIFFPCHLFCVCRVTGGELFEDIVAREFYSEADARYVPWKQEACRHIPYEELPLGQLRQVGDICQLGEIGLSFFTHFCLTWQRTVGMSGGGCWGGFEPG